MPCQICESFNGIELHDSKLVSLRLRREQTRNGADIDNVELSLKLLRHSRGTSEYVDAVLIFKDCGALRMDLDLIGKQLCADDIASALCQSVSAMDATIAEGRSASRHNDAVGFLHYTITLIPPGGEVHIFARDNELALVPPQ